MAGIDNFYRGDTKIYDIVITDDTGNPIDITGSTIWFTLKSDPTSDDTNAEIQKVITTHIDAPNGKTQVVLSKNDTEHLVPEMYYYYDFQWVTNTGDVQTIMKDKVKVLQDITRSS